MTTGRNDPCPCGSGKKHKRCCAGMSEAPPGVARRPRLPVQPRRNLPTSITARRDCDGCTACCTALVINEPQIVSPAGEPCPHLCDRGCGIHGQPRPKLCGAYLCNYLLEPSSLTVEERPDHVGAVVAVRRHERFEPPLDWVATVNECARGGLINVLQNAFWGRAIRRHLLAGSPALFSRIDDPHSREALHVRFFGGRLGCELTSCQADGSPILETMEPVQDRPIRIALVIPNQGFAFDAGALLRQLGDRDFTVIGSSTASEADADLCFLFTHRQAELLNVLRVLLRTDPSDRNRPILQSGDEPAFGTGRSLPASARP